MPTEPWDTDVCMMQLLCETSVTDKQAEEPCPGRTALFLGKGVLKTEMKRQSY